MNNRLESPEYSKLVPVGGDTLLGLKDHKVSEASNKIGTPYLQQTHNVNLMSTIKVTDLKLHFNADTVGAADSHRVFGDDFDHPLRGTATSNELVQLLNEVYIRGNDSQVLLWAHKLTSIKIMFCVRRLLKFIELLTVARTMSSARGLETLKLPSVPHLTLNLHELDNLYLLKTNEVSQKQSGKLIIINSTGRHRKAPSDFQSAKTIKRQEMH